jgi:hypothetical protein
MPNDDEPLLMDFANQFLGYVELDSPLWLIGPETGGGQTITEVFHRAAVWEKRPRKETEDLQGYHADERRRKQPVRYVIGRCCWRREGDSNPR